MTTQTQTPESTSKLTASPTPPPLERESVESLWSEIPEDLCRRYLQNLSRTANSSGSSRCVPTKADCVDVFVRDQIRPISSMELAQLPDFRPYADVSFLFHPEHGRIVEGTAVIVSSAVGDSEFWYPGKVVKLYPKGRTVVVQYDDYPKTFNERIRIASDRFALPSLDDEQVSDVPDKNLPGPDSRVRHTRSDAGDGDEIRPVRQPRRLEPQPVSIDMTGDTDEDGDSKMGNSNSSSSSSITDADSPSVAEGTSSRSSSLSSSSSSSSSVSSGSTASGGSSSSTPSPRTRVANKKTAPSSAPGGKPNPKKRGRKPSSVNSANKKAKLGKQASKPQAAHQKRQRTRQKGHLVDIECDPQSVEDWLAAELEAIVGQEKIKSQLRDFIAVTRVRRAKESLDMPLPERSALNHMVFRGPPGTGKTTIALLVSKMLYRLGVVENEKVEIVSNPLIWKGLHCGETVPKVNRSVTNAEGGVMFVDEAYLLQQANDKFGEEILGTLMDHMLPPKCVFIYAGYSEPMERFMTANAGLKSRCPYIFSFDSYSIDELVAIFRVLCKKEYEVCSMSEDELAEQISRAPDSIRASYNGRLVERLLDFSKKARDRRLCDVARTQDALEKLGAALHTLDAVDVLAGMEKVLYTSRPVKLKSDPLRDNDNDMYMDSAGAN